MSVCLLVKALSLDYQSSDKVPFLFLNSIYYLFIQMKFAQYFRLYFLLPAE